MLFPLAILISLGSLACWIMVLVKIFQNDHVGLGILGIFCPLFAFIYGWIKSGEWNIQKLMGIWSALVAASIVLNVLISNAQHHM